MRNEPMSQQTSHSFIDSRIKIAQCKDECNWFMGNEMREIWIGKKKEPQIKIQFLHNADAKKIKTLHRFLKIL